MTAVDPTTGPWLSAAMFCERVMVDGAGLSALGIFSERTITTAEPVRLSLLLVLVRGAWAGPFAANLVARSPPDEVVAAIDVTVDLPAGPEASGQVLVPISLVEVQDGVYWFELYLRGALATRLPLRIRHHVG